MAAKRKPAKKKAPKKKAAAKRAPAKKAKKRTKPPDAKEYLRGLKGMTEKGEPAWGMLAEDLFATTVKERIPTGNLGLDKLIGGGWPLGRIVEVAAWENVGKSTLLDQSMAQNQRTGGISALVDTESARDEAYTATLGVNIHELIVHPAESIEDVFAGVDKLLDLQEKMMADMKGAAPAMIIVWDAIGGTAAQAELDGAVDAKHMGVAARNIKMNFRRMCLRISKLRVCLIGANHFYKTMGDGMSRLVTYGGSGIRYFSSLRVWLRMKEQIKISEVAVGHVVEAKIKKTKVGRPRLPVDLGLIWGSGFDNSYTLFEWGKKVGVNDAHKWVVQHGSWYYLMRPDGTHEAFKHKFAGLGQVFQEHPDIYEQMATQYLSISEAA